MDDSMHDTGASPPTLDTLPSELRKLIVSFLAPTYLRPGAKQALKNANRAHRCLHEWATEYLFRDMALLHVLPGMSSHLDYFTTHPDTAHLIKYVKKVVVKVPPALRWEIGNNDVHGSRELLTMRRLYHALDVESTDAMTAPERLYCQQYHRALVEPFTNNERWSGLLLSASHTWGQILSRLVNLEEIDVGCCERADHPWGTTTHNFVQQNGKNVISKTKPAFIEDDTINKGWASLLLVQLRFNDVRSFNLTWAQTDNLNQFATVNHLLTMGYGHAAVFANRMTRLVLTLEGAAGTHGTRDWHGKTGTAGGVRFWLKTLNRLPNLKHLTFREQMHLDEDRLFTDLSESDARGCVLSWLLPGLKPRNLRTLRAQQFTFDHATVATTFKNIYPQLDTLAFDDCILDDREGAAPIHHVQGKSWLDLYHELTELSPGGRIKFNRPLSSVHDRGGYCLHPKFAEQLRHCGVEDFDADGHYYGLPSTMLDDEPLVDTITA